jgi:hypothetical protein
MMKLIAGLVVAAALTVGIGALVMRGPSNSPEIDATAAVVAEPTPVPSPITEAIRPMAGADTGGKCINPPMNTICVR